MRKRRRLPILKRLRESSIGGKMKAKVSIGPRV